MFAFPPLTPFVKKLIITLFAAFVLELVLENFLGVSVIGVLALDPVNLGPLTLFQIATYPLVDHPRQVFSLLIGLVFMWLILSPFESTFGSRPTLELSVCGVLGGGLFALLAGLLAPIHGYLFLGAHPIAYAGMAAMAQVMRGGRFRFFGVIPMTSQQLLLVLVGLSVLQFLASRDHIQLAGSLGAIVAGIGYVRYMARPKKPKRPKRTASRLRVLRGGAPDPDRNERPKWLN